MSKSSREASLLLLVVVFLPALYVAFRIIVNGVAQSDDSFVYIDNAIALHQGFQPRLLLPDWFAPGYWLVLRLFLSIDGGPIGAASWLNASALFVMLLSLSAALRRVGPGAGTAVGLTACVVLTTAVTWPFQYAWSEPLFMAISSLHLLALARYTLRPSPWDLGFLMLTAALAPWIRYAGMTVFIPLLPYAAWDLRRSRSGRGPRAATYLAGLLLAGAVPALKPGLFGSGAVPDVSPYEPLVPAVLSALRRLLSATLDALGPAVFFGFVVTLLAGAGWLLFTRGRGDPAPGEEQRQEERMVVIGYTLLWLLAYAGIASHRLMRVTHMDRPIDPFIEVRFMAVTLPWILVCLGATWGLLGGGSDAWRRRARGAATVLSIALPVVTFTTEGRAWARVLFPGKAAHPFQWGYAGQSGGRTPEVAKLLRETEPGGESVPIVLWCPGATGCPPADYFDSVFFLPHLAPTTGPALTFDIQKPRGPSATKFDLWLRASPGAPERRFAYLASTANLRPDQVVARLSEWARRDVDRFILLTLVHPQVPRLLEELSRLGYRSDTGALSGSVVWIRLRKVTDPAPSGDRE